MPFSEPDHQNPSDFDGLLRHLQFFPSILGVTLRQCHQIDKRDFELFPIVFLRHPLDRIVSIYESGLWKINKPNELASALSLKEFCEFILNNPKSEYGCRNYQTNFLSRISHGRADVQCISDVPEETDLRWAKNFLESAPLVGIVDQFAKSLRVLQSVTPSVFGVEWQEVSNHARSGTETDLETRLNIFRNQVGNELYGLISDLNASDLDLYEKGVARLGEMSIRSTIVPAMHFTGERFVPGNQTIGNDTQQEHLLRYHAVASMVAGKRVLDAACGEGYGSAILADSAGEVVGLDLSVEVIMQARVTYGQYSNLTFASGSVTKIPFPDATFDTVVSFETIEHIDAEAQRFFLSEVHRVLRPEGLLIISTPNRVNYSERPGYHNEFHVHELAPGEFQKTLAQFHIHRVYFQSMMAFSAIWHPASDAYRFNGELIPYEQDDTFLIAVCGREQSTAPIQSLCSLSYDRALSYAHLRSNLAEKEQMIARLSSWGQDLDRIVVERDARIFALQSEVEQLGAWGKERDQAVAERDQAVAVRDQSLAELKAEIADLKSRLNATLLAHVDKKNARQDVDWRKRLF
jgi:2-polyprenyl-3-methyl-5-hydroxy-6-metoxy-1,4-benzoquinol methylase